MQSDEEKRLWLMEIRYLDDIRFKWGWVKGGRYHTQAEAQAVVNKMERNWRHNMEFRITFTGGDDMTDQELQEAINKAREFMNLGSQPGGLLHKARENTQGMLKELEKIQVARAAAVVIIKDET